MPRSSIGELPAFPKLQSQADALEEPYVPADDGMTYRQWLVGQIAGGLAANPSLESSRIPDLAVQLAEDLLCRIETQSPVA